MTLFWRNNDVIITACVQWDPDLTRSKLERAAEYDYQHTPVAIPIISLHGKLRFVVVTFKFSTAYLFDRWTAQIFSRYKTII